MTNWTAFILYSMSPPHQVVNVIDGERGAELLSRVQPRREDYPVFATDLLEVQVAFVEGKAKPNLVKLKTIHFYLNGDN